MEKNEINVENEFPPRKKKFLYILIHPSSWNYDKNYVGINLIFFFIGIFLSFINSWHYAMFLFTSQLWTLKLSGFNPRGAGGGRKFPYQMVCDIKCTESNFDYEKSDYLLKIYQNMVGALKLP